MFVKQIHIKATIVLEGDLQHDVTRQGTTLHYQINSYKENPMIDKEVLS